MKTTAVLMLLFVSVFAAAAVEVDPEQAVIVVAKNADGAVRFAGSELQKYLHMITGKMIPVTEKALPGKYPFFMGTPAGVTLKPEEARWEVAEDCSRLYGDSTPVGSSGYPLPRILDPSAKSGDLSAVYDFLEKQLGVLFPAPGDENVVFTPAARLTLKEGNGTWIPPFPCRHLRPDRNFRAANRYDDKKAVSARRTIYVPPEFCPATKAEYMKEVYKTWLWLKQQRMGRSVRYAFGHAFTKWWFRFGKSHPEYFALVNGRRKPFDDRPDRVKLCVSNPAVWKRIVDDWAVREDRGHFLNVCENDSGNYCECPECRKLDLPPRAGKEWNDDLSDRYLHFADQVLKEARKIDPEVSVCHYAYSVYRFPPRREKVAPGVVIGFVPRMLELDINEAMYQGWRNAGAEKMILRPNDLHTNIGLPMGFEKHIFEAFKMGVKHGIIGTDYDSLHGFWDISGLADYLIARGNVDPTKDFEHWMKEYCSMYGDAAPDVRNYYDHFRINIWEKRLWPHRAAIIESGRRNFRRGVMWNIGNYYKESDFDQAEKLLRAGLEKKLTPQQKKRLEKMLLVNEHSRLTCRALSASGRDKIHAAVDLLKFRRANKTKLNINWERLFELEIGFGDCTGVRAAEQLADYDDHQAAPLNWYYTTDPQNTRVKDNWGKKALVEMRARWQKIRIASPGKNHTRRSGGDPRDLMRNRDGVGYYGVGLKIDPAWKGKEVFLIFGATYERVRVYVNGRSAGDLRYSDDMDRDRPIAVPITETIDWGCRYQTVVIQVEDKSGQGGIWRPVMLAARKKSTESKNR